EQGSVARRSRGDGDERRSAEWIDGCFEREICGEDRSRRWIHAMGLAGALSDQQLRRVAQHRRLSTFRGQAGRCHAGFLCTAAAFGEGEAAIFRGEGNDRGVSTLFWRVSVCEGRIQVDRSAVFGHGTSERGDLREPFREWISGARLDRRRD